MFPHPTLISLPNAPQRLVLLWLQANKPRGAGWPPKMNSGQTDKLEEYFAKDTNPSKEAKAAMASELGVEVTQVRPYPSSPATVCTQWCLGCTGCCVEQQATFWHAALLGG
jgi:hypothetical protein